MTTDFGQALPDIASVPPGPESLLRPRYGCLGAHVREGRVEVLRADPCLDRRRPDMLERVAVDPGDGGRRSISLSRLGSPRRFRL